MAQLIIDISQELHQKISDEAAQEHKSVKQFIIDAIEEKHVAKKSRLQELQGTVAENQATVKALVNC